MTLDRSLDVWLLSEHGKQSELTETWDKVVTSIGDIYYEPSYLGAAKHVDGGQVRLCLYRHELGTVVYPFVIRSLDELPFGEKLPADLFDIISPHEYGGPLVYAPTPLARRDVAKAFYVAFGEYCHSAKIVSEFVRFHPLIQIDDVWPSLYDMRRSSSNITIDLERSDGSPEDKYSKSTRRNAGIARRRGVTVERVPRISDSIEEFVELYLTTMRRLDAAPYYDFSSRYFDALADLGNDHVSLYLARDTDGRLIAGALFLLGSRYAHYHLSATLRDGRRLYPATVILDTAARDLQASGRRILHLGGAAPDQEGLHAFKAGFSPYRANYSVGTRVHHPELYDHLCRARDRHQPLLDNCDTTLFFPAYRE